MNFKGHNTQLIFKNLLIFYNIFEQMFIIYDLLITAVTHTVPTDIQMSSQ